MGTNYYKVKPLSDDIKNKMIEAIKNDEFKVEEYDRIYFPNIYDIPNTKIHIGKRSAGWKFLFDHNEWKYFKNTVDDMVSWISNPDTGEIVDEYDDKYTPEQFWKEEVEPTLTEDRWDSTTYRLAHPSGATYLPRKSDFYLGKYRIASFTNFS